jgi:hypothetical protein
MADITVKTPNGQMQYKLEDVRPYFLFDTASVASTSTELYFFQSPESKTSVETNLKQFSTIQTGWVFDVTKMRIVPRPSLSIADAKLLFENSIITYLKEGDIEIFSLPAIIMGAGAGLAGATTTTDTDIVSLGAPSQAALLKLPFPITITGGKTFTFRWKWDAAPSTISATTKVWMVLEGILRREVVGA